MPCEHDGRLGDVSTSQTTKIANKLPEARKETEDITDSHNSQKGAICQDIDLRLLALRTVGQYISIV